MTFSEARVVEHLKADFIPVWETVAPVTIATFELGGGRTVRGVQGGEIALYFCRPDGLVFDVLPALQSPNVTLAAMRDALDFYRKTGATETAIRERHSAKVTEMYVKSLGLETPKIRRHKQELRRGLKDPDPGTAALAEMRMSKLAMPTLTETITVIEPGGLDYYRKPIHEALWKEPLATPMGWKEHVFVKVMEQELKGGEFTYDADSLAPMAIIED